MTTTFPVIDFHSHYLPPGFEIGAIGDGSAQNRARWEKIASRISDKAALLEDIEAGDLAARVVNSPTALLEAPGRSLPDDIHERLNTSLAELVSDHPGKLYALASVDTFGGEAGARQLEHAVRELGLHGAFVDSAKGDLLLDAPEARPVLEAAAELRVPVFVHPVNPPGLVAQLSRFPRLGVLHARGTVNGSTLIALIEGGVLEDLPELKVVVTALAVGGVLLSATYDKGEEGRPLARDLLRRQVYAETMGFNAVLLRAVIDTIGVDHVLAGSDWPIVSTGPIAGRLFEALDEIGLSDYSKAAVASQTVLGLLHP
ncbi:MAG: amidohydrolase family protein [Mesorhizobium sp.]